MEYIVIQSNGKKVNHTWMELRDTKRVQWILRSTANKEPAETIQLVISQYLDAKNSAVPDLLCFRESEKHMDVS